MKTVFFALMLFVTAVGGLSADVSVELLADVSPAGIEQHLAETSAKQGAVEVSEVSFWGHSDQGDDFFKKFINMLTTLGLILALLLFIVWFLKRCLTTHIEKGNQESLIKVLEKRMLSPKTTLYFLEVKNKEVVLAESINGVTLLSSSSLPFNDINLRVQKRSESDAVESMKT